MNQSIKPEFILTTRGTLNKNNFRFNFAKQKRKKTDFILKEIHLFT